MRTGTGEAAGRTGMILRQIAACGVAGIVLDRQSTGNCPASPGAYGLVIELGRPVSLRVRGRQTRIPPGIYVYAGSAWGPGGLAARVGRHLQAQKAIRWHVDRLTVSADRLAAVCVAGGRECDLVAALVAGGRFAAVAAGFGSSDCRTCTSHLLAAAGGLADRDRDGEPE